MSVYVCISYYHITPNSSSIIYPVEVMENEQNYQTLHTFWMAQITHTSLNHIKPTQKGDFICLNLKENGTGRARDNP